MACAYTDPMNYQLANIELEKIHTLRLNLKAQLNNPDLGSIDRAEIQLQLNDLDEQNDRAENNRMQHLKVFVEQRTQSK